MKEVTTIILLFISNFCLSQNSFEFSIISDEDLLINKGIEDDEGNYILVGKIGNYITDCYDAYVVKLTPEGDYITKRIIKADTNTTFGTIEILNDGNYLCIGPIGVDTNGYNLRNAWFCKLDTELNIISENHFEIDSNYIAITPHYSVTDWNNNIIISGQVYYWYPAPPYKATDLFFFKINQQVDTLLIRYNKEYIGGESICGIRSMPDSTGYCFVGNGLGYFSTTHYTTLNLNLEITSVKDLSESLSQPSMGNYLTDTTLLCSGLNHFDKNQKDDVYINVMEVDTTGLVQNELILNKHTDLDDYDAWKYSNAYVNDTTIYIGGFTLVGGWSTYPSIIELFMIDKDLNVLGYNEYGGDANYKLKGIFPTSDGGCFLYAYIFDNMQGVPERDLHIIKELRENIDLITSIKKIKSNNDFFKHWPNPVKDILHIKLNKEENLNNCQLKILNISGKLMTDREVSGKGNLLLVNVKPLKSGTYIYYMTDNTGKILTGKFIKK